MRACAYVCACVRACARARVCVCVRACVCVCAYMLPKVSLQKTSTLEKGGGPQKGGRHGHRPRGRAVPRSGPEQAGLQDGTCTEPVKDRRYGLQEPRLERDADTVELPRGLPLVKGRQEGSGMSTWASTILQDEGDVVPLSPGA